MKTKKVPEIEDDGCYGCVHSYGNRKCKADDAGITVLCRPEKCIYIEDTIGGEKKYIVDKARFLMGVKQ